MSSIRPWRDIARRQSRQIMVGSVPVGGDAPITVQTMTNTPTADAVAGLIALGYKPHEASRFVHGLETKGMKSEEIIHVVLKSLAPK